MATTTRWLTTRDAADRACCGQATIRRVAREGRLRAVRVSGNGELRFLERWIDQWLADQLMPEDDEIEAAIDVAPSLARALSSW
jgi:excisionase family DNA binding protein